MALRPLTPQSDHRVRWETALTEALAALWECDYGDAAGFLEAHQTEVDELYAGGSTAKGAANLLNNIDAGA